LEFFRFVDFQWVATKKSRNTICPCDDDVPIVRGSSVEGGRDRPDEFLSEKPKRPEKVLSDRLQLRLWRGFRFRFSLDGDVIGSCSPSPRRYRSAPPGDGARIQDGPREPLNEEYGQRISRYAIWPSIWTAEIIAQWSYIARSSSGE
jgi:hypothetical protein